MNVILLDKSNPDIAKAVEGCEVGVPQTFTVTVTPTTDDGSVLVGTIDSISYEESEEEPIEEALPGAKKPKTYKPRGAVEEVIE